MRGNVYKDDGKLECTACFYIEAHWRWAEGAWEGGGGRTEDLEDTVMYNNCSASIHKSWLYSSSPVTK